MTVSDGQMRSRESGPHARCDRWWPSVAGLRPPVHRFQVPVSAGTWGFNSPLAHYLPPAKLRPRRPCACTWSRNCRHEESNSCSPSPRLPPPAGCAQRRTRGEPFRGPARPVGRNPDAYPVYGNATTLAWAASTRRSTRARGRRDLRLTCRDRPAVTGALVPRLDFDRPSWPSWTRRTSRSGALNPRCHPDVRRGDPERREPSYPLKGG